MDIAGPLTGSYIFLDEMDDHDKNECVRYNLYFIMKAKNLACHLVVHIPLPQNQVKASLIRLLRQEKGNHSHQQKLANLTKS